MPKKIALSQEQLDFIKANHDKLPYTQLAPRVGMCVDTLKRFLVRLNLRDDIEGAKYVTARKADVATWKRPCMKCGDDRPRPKWLYFCEPCRSRLETSAIDL